MSIAQHTIKTGTTNQDGTGTSDNLTDAHLVLQGSGSVDTPAYEVANDHGTIQAESAIWNGAGTKEVKIVADNIDVLTLDYVDVDIDLSQSTQDVHVTVLNSKRGQIETGSGDDTVDVIVHTNNAGWVNKFSIDTGDGNDVVTVVNGKNSQFTSLDIQTGNGDDTVDLAGLKPAADGVTRIIDTGDGDDEIIGSQGSDIIIGGAGNDIINGGSGNDIIYFDAQDTFVNGGKGFDTLVLSEVTTFSVIDGSKFIGFEAIVGHQGLDESVQLSLQEGLVIRLGGDAGDTVTFNEATNIVALGASEQSTLAITDVDMSGLQAFQADSGGQTFIVWSDTALV